MKDRDMYYGNYGYSGYYPIPNMPNQMNGMIPPQMGGIPNNSSYNINQLSDLNDRIDRLERQVKRLDQRLTRLETPYANVNNSSSNNEPDNNMYMM